MASSDNNPNRPSFTTAFPSADAASLPNTTFVQADPSTFRAVVQRFTGASPAKTAAKPPPTDTGPRRPAFKLHERRPTARKLEIKLNGNGGGPQSPSAIRNHRSAVVGESTAVFSPVSPLEYAAAREEEVRAIAEKGFYLSPLSTPRGSDPPQLLALFPLHSPRDY